NGTAGPVGRRGGCDRELHADADGRVYACRPAISRVMMGAVRGLAHSCEETGPAPLLRRVPPLALPTKSLSSISIPRVSRRSRERDRVAHVGEARDVRHGALKAEAEARVRHRAIAAQIPVPGVVLLVDSTLRHARVPP